MKRIENSSSLTAVRRAAGFGMTVAVLLLSAIPAHSGPGDFFKGVGRAVKSTASNFVTWKDPWRNVAYIALAAGIAADMHSTAAKTQHCAAVLGALVRHGSCYESNPILPAHPTPGVLAIYGASEFLLITTATTAFRESRPTCSAQAPLAGDTSRCMGPGAKAFPLLAIGGLSIGHTVAATQNYRLRPELLLHDPIARPGVPR